MRCPGVQLDGNRLVLQQVYCSCRVNCNTRQEDELKYLAVAAVSGVQQVIVRDLQQMNTCNETNLAQVVCRLSEQLNELKILRDQVRVAEAATKAGKINARTDTRKIQPRRRSKAVPDNHYALAGSYDSDANLDP